jgi:hypothetical protein
VTVAIHFPEPPQDVATAAAAHEIPGALQPRAGAGGAAPPAAQPVFTAGMDAIVEHAGNVGRVANAPTSWRYASEVGGAPRVFEFAAKGTPGKAQTPRVGDDRFTPAIRHALTTAQDDPRVRAHDFEARLLRVPALKLLAVWLHGAGTNDLFVPVARTTVDASPGELYDADDFRSRLHQAASRTLSLYEDAERPDELGG